MSKLEIKDLYVSVKINDNETKQILKGVNLTINSGEIHAIMGPNGSGKSTLSYTIAGHPNYIIDKGSIELDGEIINDLSPDKRSHIGLFLAMQYPVEIPGVSLTNFLRTAINSDDKRKMDLRRYVKELKNSMDELKMGNEFSDRSVNVGFSGGEKKRAEILQMKLLKPKFAILDETDSGLDVDALKLVSEGIVQEYEKQKFGIILVTHYTRILKYVKPDFVHVFKDGKIVESGTKELAQKLEDQGYKDYE